MATGVGVGVGEGVWVGVSVDAGVIVQVGVGVAVRVGTRVAKQSSCDGGGKNCITITTIMKATAIPP